MNEVLMLGAGPVAALASKLLEASGHQVTLLSRPGSERGEMIASREGHSVVTEASKPNLAQFCGRLNAQVVFDEADLKTAHGLVFVAVPLTVARESLEKVLKAGKVAKGAVVVILSSGLGLAAELQTLAGVAPRPRYSVVTFSHFFAAAKWRDGSFVVRALKKQIRLGGPDHARIALKPYLSALREHGVAVEENRSVLWAESRNLNLYVHSALGLSSYALEATFSRSPCPRYLYKLYPEGPVSPETMRGYARLLRELHRVFAALGLPDWNFLEFLQEEGYPVPEVYLHRTDIERFPHYGLRRQAELLYARYTGLLVDPYSVPDDRGRYFDFSAVPIEPISTQSVPRIPGEELFNLWVARGLAEALGIRTAMMTQLLGNFLRMADRAEGLTHATSTRAWRTAKERGLSLGRLLRAQVQESSL